MDEGRLLALSARESLAVYLGLVHRTEQGREAIPPKHLLEQVIPAILDDTLGPTVIVAPPGSVKTNTMVGACEWWLGRDQSLRLAYICNDATAADERSTVVQDVVQSSDYLAIFPEVKPNKNRSFSKSEWYLDRPNISDKNPTFIAAGLGGQIQGNRLDRAVIDDIADEKNMLTELQRKGVQTYLDTILMPRFLGSQVGRPIMIGTRWHEDDPIAWASRQGWHTVHIPAITEEGESYWPDERPLDPLRLPNGNLIMGISCTKEHAPGNERCCWRKSLGEKQFQLVFMGQVVSDTTALFKRRNWRFYKSMPQTHQGGIFIDLAHTEQTSGDYTVISVVATDGKDRYWRHLIRERMEFPEVVRTVKGLRPHFPYTIVVEDTPGSKALLQTLQRDLWGVLPFRLGARNKVARAEATADAHEAGNWYLPENESWTGPFVEEHASFPSSQHDDMVDTSTMMELYFRGKSHRPSNAPKRPFKRSWDLVKA